jgi:hypothetical protein
MNIATKQKEYRERVYQEMRERYNTEFRQVVATSEVICLRNRVSDHKLAADIEISMMLHTFELLEKHASATKAAHT